MISSWKSKLLTAKRLATAVLMGTLFSLPCRCRRERRSRPCCRAALAAGRIATGPLPNKTSPDGNYVWRIVSDGANERGFAWSRRYDYGKHTWVFRVYMNKEPAE